MMPVVANSSAHARVTLISAALAAPYALRSGAPSATRLAMLTTRPHPCSRMPGNPAQVTSRPATAQQLRDLALLRDRKAGSANRIRG